MNALPPTNILAGPNIQQMDRRRGHRFTPPKAVIEKIPPLYSQDHIPLAEQTVHVHYFYGNCDWYILEYDPETGIAFGAASLGYGYELGSMDLVEMGTTPAGYTAIEREVDWQPRAVKDIPALAELL